MYNRYIPQSDGSFRRNRISESGKNQQKPMPQSQRGNPTGNAPHTAVQQVRNPPPKQQSAESFLKNLLPKGLDTGDLLIAVLLLLMAGDCQEDKNTALLTLALYLFM